jgi:hypothetical protein
VEPADPEANAAALGAIKEWTRDHNDLKQKGLYVDVDLDGAPLAPASDSNPKIVRQVFDHVHQIGWQPCLGEHPEGKAQRDRERELSAWSPSKVADFMSEMPAASAELISEVASDLALGQPGEILTNANVDLTRCPADQSMQ